MHILLPDHSFYYAVLSPGCDSTQLKALLDRIAMFSEIELLLKIAYNPNGNFNLHEFHYALNKLPTNEFSLNPIIMELPEASKCFE
ncbi:hypothetical protein ACJIZ3_010169 [Penstemon smallii]|uniref:Uncharacterized protein n=1 Tax=Penstemon smallii TaxID=265156 RepID=A0ABD3TFY4_9LAMI